MQMLHCNVEIIGLLAKPEYNGQTGVAVGYDHATGRYAVDVTSPEGGVNKRKLNVRQINLRLRPTHTAQDSEVRPNTNDPKPVASYALQADEGAGNAAEVEADDTPPEATRVAEIIQTLIPTLAGSEERRVLVEELHALLSCVSESGSKPVQRATARAFTDAKGAQVLYDIETLMRGNWRADAKNGTLSKISRIFELPGAICKNAAQQRNKSHSDQSAQAAANCTADCCWGAADEPPATPSAPPAPFSLPGTEEDAPSFCQRVNGKK